MTISSRRRVLDFNTPFDWDHLDKNSLMALKCLCGEFNLPVRGDSKRHFLEAIQTHQAYIPPQSPPVGVGEPTRSRSVPDQYPSGRHALRPVPEPTEAVGASKPACNTLDNVSCRRDRRVHPVGRHFEEVKTATITIPSRKLSCQQYSNDLLDFMIVIALFEHGFTRRRTLAWQMCCILDISRQKREGGLRLGPTAGPEIWPHGPPPCVQSATAARLSQEEGLDQLVGYNS
jgi:hypothetical protein